MGLDGLADVSAQVPVSVVIPAYNAVETLPRAIASVRAQTRAPAEIIIVDDASSDRTRDVVGALSNELSDLQVRSVALEKNVGAASARNIAWEHATQDYVAFLDADDAWHPRKLEVQYSWLSTHPEVVLCGHRCLVLVEGDPAPELPETSPSVARFGLRTFLIGNRLSTPTVMVRRAIQQRFTDGKRYSEDYLLWMQIVATHGPAAFIDLPLAFLFKARFGAAGLSGRHWDMRRGESDTFRQLRQGNIIGWPEWATVASWAWLKFAARVARQQFAGPPRQ